MGSTKPLAKNLTKHPIIALVICCALVLALAAMAGCATQGNAGASEPEPTDGKTGYGMGGVNQDIVVSKAAIENAPHPWVLTSPEAAVRSYLDWVSYAYRTGQSEIATPVMSPYQEVRVDAYTQLNLQKERLLDQTLDSITFGTLSKEETHVLLPAKENWTYRYVSIEVAGETIGGPYTASYETTYTLVKSDGEWRVDSIEVTALDTVK